MYVLYGLIPVVLLAFWCIHFSLVRYFETQTQINTLLQQVDLTRMDIMPLENGTLHHTDLQNELDIIQKELMVAVSSKNIFLRDRVYKKCRTDFEQTFLKKVDLQ